MLILVLDVPFILQAVCMPQTGLCDMAPETPILHFTRSPPAINAAPTPATAGTASEEAGRSASGLGLGPGAAAAVSYYIHLTAQLPYQAAADMCGTSTYMGLAWRLVAAQVFTPMI
jgi:hypothetical protein